MKQSPFSSLVRAGMERRGLGLRELCREARLDPSYLSKVLAGKRSPPSEEESLRRLAAALELVPGRLIAAAGRIPSEWNLLAEDEGVFEEVDRLLLNRGRIPTAPRAALPPSRRDDFGTELL